MTDKIITDIFKNNKNKNFEFRKTQVEIAKQINQAIKNYSHLIIEAGTGTGKTLAYLIPIILHLNNSSKKAIIITYTKALQNQILKKDLPLAKQILNDKYNITPALFMGSNNYLCLLRWDRYNEELFTYDKIEDIKEWVKKTKEGILTEINIPSKILSKINRDTELCLKSKCPLYNDCFYYKAKRKAGKSNLIIVNHSLFFANVQSNFNIFPKGNILVIDEAHQIEDVATKYLSIDISLKLYIQFLESLYKTKNSFFKNYDIYDSEIVIHIRSLETLLTTLFNFLVNTFNVTDKKRIKTKIKCNELDKINKYFNKIIKSIEKIDIDIEEFSAEQENIINKLTQMKENINTFMNHSKEVDIYAIEKTHNDINLKVIPLKISDIFEKNILENYDSVILTSATLTINNSFEYFKSIIQTNTDIKSIQYPSIFNFKKQSLLYIPEKKSLTDEKEYLAKQIIELLTLTEGHTFVLFTNFQILKEIYKKVKKEINYPIFKHNDYDSYNLIKKYKKTKNAVLFGNITFWQGVDIPGDNLKSVIITHLPFKVPTDPVIEARSEYYNKITNNSFIHYYLPMAGIILKQGFGRLIRTETDSGIISILDSRIIKKSYGKILLNSLPEVIITSNIQEVKKFCKKIN